MTVAAVPLSESLGGMKRTFGVRRDAEALRTPSRGGLLTILLLASGGVAFEMHLTGTEANCFS